MTDFQLSELPLSDTASRRRAEEFLNAQGLCLDKGLDRFVILERDGTIVASGGLDGFVLKCLAVCKEERGEGLMAIIVSRLVNIVAENGNNYTMVFTKPEYRATFESLGYTLLAEAPKAVLLESDPFRKEHIKRIIGDGFSPCFPPGVYGNLEAMRLAMDVGVIVMNADPPTLGHYYLLKEALRQVDFLAVFLTLNYNPFISSQKRYDIVWAWLEELSESTNKKVFIMGNDIYTLSRFSFPTYFLKEPGEQAETEMRLNLDIFRRLHIPATGAIKRFVGTEPHDPLTRRYNELMHEMLPIEVVEVERTDDISASAVRRGPLLAVGWMLKRNSLLAVVDKYIAEALQAELDLTPKPGLIDRSNNGAHLDMTYDTMQRGINAIADGDFTADFWLEERNSFPYPQCMGDVQMKWKKATAKMLQATGGTNTHKGILFAFACTLCGASLIIKDRNASPEALKQAIILISGMAESDNNTHGAQVRRKYRVEGALEMARSGYAPLFDRWLPFWRKTHDQHRLLLTIMSELDDTCILYRGGTKALDWVKQQAAKALQDFSLKRLEKMNEAFCHRNLSPGGSADMFALTLFIDKLVGEE